MDLDFYKIFYDLNNYSKNELKNHYKNIGKKKHYIKNIQDFLNKYEFNLHIYKTCNSDLSTFNELELMKHFENYGKNEKRIYNRKSFFAKYPDFKIEHYRNFNLDLIDFDEIRLIEHYVKYGQFEDRCFGEEKFYKKYPDFDINVYRSLNNDLSSFGNIDLLYHFERYGKNEDRIFGVSSFIKKYPDFNINLYKLFNNDLTRLSNLDLIVHFDTYGKNENRIYSYSSFYQNHPNFNLNFYKTMNSSLWNEIDDVVMAYYVIKDKKNNLINIDEFFKNFPEFDLNYYKSFNKEISNLSDNELCYHYCFTGKIDNKIYLSFDFKVQNYNEPINDSDPLYNRILSHYDYRRIDNVKDLKAFIESNNYVKKYWIHSRESFFIRYPDFDLEFYRNKYFENSSLSDMEILLDYHLVGKLQKRLYNNRHLIVIYVPPFVIHIGGVVAIHYLAKLINDLKHPKYYAKYFNNQNLKYKNIFCNNFADLDEINDNTMVIYPETIAGNPLGCKNVLRWILLLLGIEMPIDFYKKWDKNDLIYFWESTNQNISFFKQITCPWLNPIFFRSNYAERKNSCYLVKKGIFIHSEIIYFHPPDSICLDNVRNLIEINNILNSCKYFYCYDPNCAFIIYAVICGCIPIIYPIRGVSESDYFKSRIYNFNDQIINDGVCYGYNGINIYNAESIVNSGKNVFTDLFNNYNITVTNFISDLDVYFNPNKPEENNLPLVKYIYDDPDVLVKILNKV